MRAEKERESRDRERERKTDRGKQVNRDGCCGPAIIRVICVCTTVCSTATDELRQNKRCRVVRGEQRAHIGTQTQEDIKAKR